jgi:hypothetical protein
MSDIRDSKGTLIGRYTQEGSTPVLRDEKGNKLGYIDLQGKTRDAKGNLVGDSAMLGTLLKR